MQVNIDELMNKLGVGFVLGPYQTMPWSYTDVEAGVTCSAEVRMGPDGEEIEAEAQMMYDDPPEGVRPMEQICYIRAAPSKDGQWSVGLLRIRGEPYGQDIYNWEEKCCDFFAGLVRSLQLDEIPDIDELLDDAFHGGERFADQYGGGGGKSPKIRAGQVLGMKKGRGF